MVRSPAAESQINKGMNRKLSFFLGLSDLTLGRRLWDWLVL
jgi:hypothetical protein